MDPGDHKSLIDPNTNQPFPEKIDRKKKFFSSLKKWHRLTLWVIGGIGILTGLIIGLGRAEETLEDWGFFTKENTPTSIFKSDSTYNILLLPFGSEGNCIPEENRDHIQVYRRIDSLNRADRLNIELRRQDIIPCDWVNVDSVSDYGKKLGADLVIYGNYYDFCPWDTTLLNIQFVLLDTLYSPSAFRYGESKFKVSKIEIPTKLRSGKLTGTVEDVMYWALAMREGERKSFKQTVAYLDKILIPENKIEYAKIFFYKGLALFYLKNYKASIANYDKAIKLDSNDIKSYVNRGITKNKIGQCEAAVDDFDKAIELNPKAPLAYFNRGASNFSLGQYLVSIDDFDKAIKLNPNDVMSYHHRGMSKSELGDFKDAILDFDKAIELNPRFLGSYNWRGDAKFQLGQLKAAIADFNKVIELNPMNYSVYILRGMAKENQGRYKTAIYDFNKAIELNPQNPNAYIARGLTKNQLGDSISAKRDFHIADSLKNINQ